MRAYRLRIFLAILTVIIAAMAGLGGGVSSADPGIPAPVSLVGSTEKVCQLNGENDWVTNSPTAAHTFTNAGLIGGDLGYPVEHAGKLLLLFGDSWPPDHPKGSPPDLPPDDSVGITTRTKTPDGEKGCIGMTIQTSAPKKFSHPTVIAPASIHQGFFNVPSGGLSVGGHLYAFFWTNHCANPVHLAPSPSAPLAPVPASTQCSETVASNSIGINVLARSDDDARTFTVPSAGGSTVSMPIGFVYAIGVNATKIAGLPADQSRGVFIFAVPRYRASVPYLAYSPTGTFADPSTWRFFTGLSPEGRPKWVDAKKWAGSGIAASWAPPGQAELYNAATDAERCIGEFSVTWNRPLQSWLMLYQCGHDHGVEARIAQAPWGPWSPPTSLIVDGPQWACKLVMIPAGCAGQKNFWPKSGKTFVAGGYYAPFVMDRYTLDASGGGSYARTTIFWTLSTWNPYEVVIMRSTLQSGTTMATPRPRPSIRWSPHPIPVGSHPI